MTVTKAVFLCGFALFINSLLLVPETQGLDCFACHSINGSDRRCEDPMIRIYEGFIKPETCVLPTKIIQSSKAPPVGPGGDLPNVDVVDINGTAVDKGPGYAVEVEMPRQSYCVKIIGSTIEDRSNVIIRTCIDQDLNSQCGLLTFREQKIRGCMLTCQNNMCNGAIRKLPALATGIVLSALLVLAV